MKEYDIKKYKKRVKQTLDRERFEHTLGVMYTAAALAMRYEADISKAQVAGLLHDCAKCISDDRKILICDKHNIAITNTERKNPFLLHAKVGAYFALDKYGVTDKEIIHAILNHTTGRPEMSLLEKIIFIADYIEPKRGKAIRLPYIRKLAFLDIDLCMYEILKDTLLYLREYDGDIDPMTQKACMYYEKVCNQNKSSDN